MQVLNNEESCSIHITDCCNLKCPNCYTNNCRKNTVVNIESACKFIEWFKPKNIVLFGGEAILFPKIIENLLNKYENINFSLHTNGTLFTPENRYLYNRFKYIFLSLDSLRYDWLKENKGFSKQMYFNMMNLIDECCDKINITKNILPSNNDKKWFTDIKKYNFIIDYYPFITIKQDQEFLSCFRTEIDSQKIFNLTLNVKPKIRLLSNGTVTRDMRGIYNMFHINNIPFDIEKTRNNILPISDICKKCQFLNRCLACNMFPHFVKDVIENVNYIPHFCKFTKIYWREKC